MMSIIALKVEVPIACFRDSRAREYIQTYPVPPPSTVYGMLLSMVGEIDRYKHRGGKLAIALLVPRPEISRVIRTFRRFKKKDLHDPTNARPDYQELLTDVRFVVWIDSENDRSTPNLCQRIQTAIASPETINRFGGLSLGESRDLVNEVAFFQSTGKEKLIWLEQQEDGLLALPYWVDHVGAKNTRWRRYELLEPSDRSEPDRSHWTTIQSA